MRRDNKYGTNKTVRFCQRHAQKVSYNYSSEQTQICIDKRGRWKIMEFLKKHTQSYDYSNKIVLRHNYNFYQYNGYKNVLRENPPKHLSFPCRPDFVYQPYVNFIKVNHNTFNLALHYGWKFLNNQKNLVDLLEVNLSDIPVILIYFLDDMKHFRSPDWVNAHRHAFGGHFAAYHMVCSGDYCPFGPKIRGIGMADPRIKHVVLIAGNYHKLEQCSHCYCDSWKHPTNHKRHEYKTERSQLKTQRQEKHKLTKQAKAVQNFRL